MKEKILTEKQIKAIWEKFQESSMNALNLARTEPQPTAESVWDYVYAGNENADWRKF